MHSAIQNRLLLGLGVLLSVLVVNASITYRNLSDLRNTSHWTGHTLEVLTALETVFSDLTDAEAAERGYVITGKEEYLAPYEAATGRNETNLVTVERLTKDNPEQQRDAARLRDVLNRRVDVMQRTLDIRRTDGLPAAQEFVSMGAGRKIMDEIRALVAAMERREESLLAERQAEDQEAHRTAIITLIVTTLSGIAVGVAFVWLLQRHLKDLHAADGRVHAQRELLQATLSSIGDGVIATDAAGRVTFLNGIAQTLTGWSEQEAAGVELTKVFRIVNEETRAEVDNPAMRALRDGKIVGLANHTILLTKGGGEWPIDDSAAPIKNQNGEVQGAILVFREIKERKRAEQELRAQSAALAEADRRKNEFLATLAHELRNPLAPISNALQLWSFVENDKAEMTNLRALMERQLGLMIRLVDDLLDVSRITRGKIQLRKERVDVRSLITSALEAVKPIVEACEHRVTTNLPPTPLEVEGDAARLTQVLGNILNNAAKYTGRHGAIEVTALQQADRVVVRIRDDGPGIPADMLEPIFEMFRQVDGTLERSHGGLGIGLTLVRRLVEEHGGTVVARSEGAGRGSEFEISLPAAAQLESAANPAVGAAANASTSNSAAAAAKQKILVVDDISASARTLAAMLKALGHESSIANDGPSGIAWVREHKPDVVFLDIAMPGMNGYEAAKEIRAESHDVYLIALTGYGNDEDRRRAAEAGFDRHCIKPISLDKLREALAAAADKACGARGA
jgi:PAS domain S-box-containing protein